MKKFEVVVTRTAFSAKTIEVEAENEEQARQKAVDEAGGYEFPTEYAADYEVEFILEKEKE
jgi:hypothetical protein